MNRIEERLLDFVQLFGKGDRIIEWNDTIGFQKNYILNYKYDYFSARYRQLKNWRNFIGKEVHPSINDFSYCPVETYHSQDYLNKLNFDEKQTIIFTEDLFNKFCEDYLNYSVEYLTDDLLWKSLTSNSTNKLTNLVFEWELECKQDILKDLKNILKWK